jgi:uncharacterized damage-inducible protein DinB
MPGKAAAARANIENALQGYVVEVRLAGPHWERKPTGSPEGEAAWNARQVAEHIAGAATFFGAGIATALGIPGPARTQPTFNSAEEAFAGTGAAHEALFGVVDGLSDEQVAAEFETPRFGKTSAANMLALITNHLGDHTGQLRTLREG